MSKYEGHTPGPWEYARVTTSTSSDGSSTGYWLVRRVWQDKEGRRCIRFIAEVCNSVPRIGQAEVNARLIADAPVLLADNARLRAALEKMSEVVTDEIEDEPGDYLDEFGPKIPHNPRRMDWLHALDAMIADALKGGVR